MGDAWWGDSPPFRMGESPTEAALTTYSDRRHGMGESDTEGTLPTDSDRRHGMGESGTEAYISVSNSKYTFGIV
jgi:hypothetical protein